MHPGVGGSGDHVIQCGIVQGDEGPKGLRWQTTLLSLVTIGEDGRAEVSQKA